MRNVARFRIRGHGLKCETGLYGRSRHRIARVAQMGSANFPGFPPLLLLITSPSIRSDVPHAQT
jgi:hypothetical protein